RRRVTPSTCGANPRDLHPFPTRRSSDLPARQRVYRNATGGRLPRSGGTRQPRAARTLQRTPPIKRLTPGLNTSAKMPTPPAKIRSEEHTSELQSRENLVCRLLREKKNDS